MNSSLCYGWVSHRRLAPRFHGFRYRSAMLYLDLDEQDLLLGLSPLLGASRLAPLCWRETDYLPAWTRRGMPLKDAVREVVAKALGQSPCGAIHLLTQPRSWGLSFNPVSFYFCHDSDDLLAAIVLEVRNTPWRERFHYVLPVLPGQPWHFSVTKAFHVSPFMPMDCIYDFSIQPPQERVKIAINEKDADGPLLFASFAGERRPLSDRALLKALLTYPLMTMKIMGAIHFEAVRLWFKGVPLHRHLPSKRRAASSLVSTEIQSENAS